MTIVNTMHLHKHGQPISIGRPVPNTSVYILGQNEQPLEIGRIGVMWVSGKGVSNGYLNLDGVTRERFKADIFRKDGCISLATLFCAS